MRSNFVDADVGEIEPIVLEPDRNPTAAYVKPQVTHQLGNPDAGGGFRVELQDRQAYYDSTHLQTIKFEIAREIVRRLTEGGDASAKVALTSRHQLFPQVYRIVEAYVDTRVSARGCDMRELGLQTYAQRTSERLLAAIEPDDDEGDPPLLPLLSKSRPMGDTSRVSFKTVRPCVPTVKSQIDQVVSDTQSWGAGRSVPFGAVAARCRIRAQRPSGAIDSVRVSRDAERVLSRFSPPTREWAACPAGDQGRGVRARSHETPIRSAMGFGGEPLGACGPVELRDLSRPPAAWIDAARNHPGLT